MPISIELMFIAIAVLLMLSVVASKISDRFGIPALLFFLAIGMLAGSDGLGGIYFDDARLAQNIGVLALVIILFSGGLDTQWAKIRPVIQEGLVLATLGVLFTAAVLGVAAHLILGVRLVEGMLLGAITSSTDAAAVFAILRSKGVTLKGKLTPLLELESGCNDPMAVFLTVGLIQLIANPAQSPWSLVPFFFQQMIIGAIAGYLGGRLLLFLINRFRFGYEGLYPVMVFGMILLTYGATNLIGGSGFLAVYGVGLVLGKEEFLHKRSLSRFYDSLAWLMQIGMFLTLGLLVFPSRLGPVILPGLALAAVLILFARPISVFLTTALTRLSWREKTLISWVGLRGAVPIILATYPKLAGLPQSELIFNIIFFVVLTSVLIQGTSIPMMANWLKLQSDRTTPTPYPLESVPQSGWKGELKEIQVPGNSWAIGKAIYELGLPYEYLIVMIARGDEFIIPNGTVVLQPGDRLLGLSSPELREDIEKRLSDTRIQKPG